MRRRAFILGPAAALFLTTALLAQAPPTPRKLSNAETKEAQSAMKFVDDAVAGRPMTNDLGLAWAHEDIIKAQGNKEFVPFSITIDRSKFTGNKLSLYWRVIAPTAAPPAEAAGKDAKKDDKKKEGGKPEYAWEGWNMVNVESKDAGPFRISRSFMVPAGTYDVYIVAKEPSPEKPAKNAPPVKTSTIKQSVTVPDFWNDELNTSSIIVADRLDPLPTPLTPTQQEERPYAMGTMELIPSTTTKFPKNHELTTFLFVYNAKTDAASKPDVSIEYNFYAKPAGAPEKFFNKTNPQSLNAQTLPPNFDFAAGHQLQSGQSVPLASFPEGDYRLEIKVTDKIANKSLTRDVNFTVAGS